MPATTLTLAPPGCRAVVHGGGGYPRPELRDRITPAYAPAASGCLLPGRAAAPGASRPSPLWAADPSPNPNPNPNPNPRRSSGPPLPRRHGAAQRQVRAGPFPSTRHARRAPPCLRTRPLGRGSCAAQLIPASSPGPPSPETEGALLLDSVWVSGTSLAGGGALLNSRPYPP